jgi:hypothetical protein
MPTFYKCGSPTDSQATEDEGAGTIYFTSGASGAKGTVRVENANFTSNRAKYGNGAILYSDGSTTMPAFRYVNCANSEGVYDIYYAGVQGSWTNMNYRFGRIRELPRISHCNHQH